MKNPQERNGQQLCGCAQMRQGRHRFSSLPKIYKELIKLMKNPKRFCNMNNVQGLRSKKLQIDIALPSLKFFWYEVKEFEKKILTFFSKFFTSYQKILFVSLLENTPYFNFLPNDDRVMSIYNFLLLRPCTLVVLQRSQNCVRFFIKIVSSF